MAPSCAGWAMFAQLHWQESAGLFRTLLHVPASGRQTVLLISVHVHHDQDAIGR